MASARPAMKSKVDTLRIANVPTFREYHAARRQHLRNLIAECWQRIRSRYELAGLSDADLRDIGVSRATAEFESTKPFWRE
jgi:uncharacterized protein YjiS (DUF1127 family)